MGFLQVISKSVIVMFYFGPFRGQKDSANLPYLVVEMAVSWYLVSKLGDLTPFRGLFSTNLQGLPIVITQLITSY